ncbi:MAG: short-chain dehydrogenase/reductase [Actinomycetia bacterium]|nr:short-chain dehydrogenase/reductase [Actinomycetes bacterium]
MTVDGGTMGQEVRTAIVTGASGGVGRATAVALGAIGWNVAIGARRADALADTADLVEKAGGAPFAAPLDIADPQSVDDFFAAVTERFGPPDALVNNASLANIGRFHEQSPADFARDVQTNLLGTMFCARAMIRSLMPGDTIGDILFVSSESAHAPWPELVGYGTTKAGIEGLARGLTQELEGTGIRIGILRIGATLTDFGSTWPEGKLASVMEQWPYFGIQRHFGYMLPEDIAATIVHVLTLPPNVQIPQLDLRPVAPAGSGPWSKP